MLGLSLHRNASSAVTAAKRALLLLLLMVIPRFCCPVLKYGLHA